MELKYKSKKIVVSEYLSTKSRKNILLVHGAYMNSYDFQHLAKYLQSKKYNVYVIDLSGHGESETIEKVSYKDYINQVKKAIETIGKCDVLGISMGSMILSELLNNEKVKKVILMSIPLAMPKNGKFMMLQLKLLPQMLSGKIRVNPKELISNYSEDEIEKMNLVKNYEPVNIMQESGNFDKVFNNLKKSKKELNLIYGEDDYTVDTDKAKLLKNANIKIFKGMSHLLIHEKQRKKVHEYVFEILK